MVASTVAAGVVAGPASARNGTRVFGLITGRAGESVAGAAFTPEFVGGLARNCGANETGEFPRGGHPT